MGITNEILTLKIVLKVRARIFKIIVHLLYGKWHNILTPLIFQSPISVKNHLMKHKFYNKTEIILWKILSCLKEN